MSFFPICILIAILVGGLTGLYFQIGQILGYEEARAFLHALRNQNIVPVEDTDGTSYLARIERRAAEWPTRGWYPPGAWWVARHVRTVTEQGGNLDVRLVTDVTVARQNAHLRATFPTLLISAALILGLAGTFLSFRGMLIESDLGNIVYHTPTSGGEENSEEILKASSRLLPAFQKIYEGLHSAFTTSIFGIGCTITLLAVGSLGVTPRREEFLAELEEFTGAVLMPLYSTGDSGTVRLARATEYADKILANAEATTAHLSTLGASFNGLSASLTGLTGQVEASLGQNSQLSVVLEGVTNQLVTTEQRWKTMLESLDASRVTMSGMMTKIQEHAQTVLGTFHAEMDASAREMSVFGKTVVTEIQSVAAAKLDHFTQVNAEMRKGSQRLLGEWREGYEKLLEQQAQTGAKLLARSGETEKELARALAAHAGQVTDQSAASTAQINQVALQLLQALAVTLEQREVLAASADHAAGRVETLLAQHARDQEARLGEFQANCASLTEQWHYAVASSSTTLDQAASSLVEAVRSQRPVAQPPSWRRREEVPEEYPTEPEPAPAVEVPPRRKRWDPWNLDRSIVLRLLGRRPRKS